MKSILVNTFAIAQILFLSVLGYSQSIDTLVRINLGAYDGYATYGFEIKGKDTVLNGQFNFDGPILDTFVLGHSNFFNFNGNFSDNKPVGLWDFNLTSIKKLGKTTYQDHHLKVNVDIVGHHISGIFEDYNKNTNWTHKIYLHSQVQTPDTVFTSTIQNVEDTDNKELMLETEDYSLKGKIAKDNFVDESWVWTQKEDSSVVVWEFEDGLLTKIYDANQEWLFDGVEKVNNSSKNNAFLLGKEYIGILKMKLILAGLEVEMAPFVATFSRVDSLEKIRKGIIQTLNGEYTPPLAFKLPFDALDESENLALGVIRRQGMIMDSIFNSIAEVESMPLLKEGFPEILPLLDSVQAIYGRDFYIVDQIREFFAAGLLPYLDRNRLVDFLMQRSRFSDYEQQDSSFPFNTLALNGKNSIDDLIDLEEKIMVLKDQRQKQQKLLQLEETMLGKKETVETALGFAKNNLPKSYLKSLFAIQILVDTLISEYWSNPSTIEKLVLAEKNLTCLDQLLGLIQTLSLLPSEEEKIGKLYTESTFNVHTATEIEYFAQKKILLAYFNLIPYIQELVASSVNCSNVTDLQRIISITNERMYDLRGENTRDLENRLNNEMPAKEVLHYFGIKTEGEL